MLLRASPANCPRHRVPSTARSCVRACASSESPEAHAASLNATHGLPGSVSFSVGPGGLVKALLTHASGSSAEVHLHGATVTSWCLPSGDEVLYLRPDALFTGAKPIAGGVPLCFPVFGPSPEMQQHGFARNLPWEVLRTSGDVNPDYPEPSVTLRLSDSAATRSVWAHAFVALLEVTLRRDRLKMVLRVRNSNELEPFSFTAAMHSYFEVVDAALPSVKVTGLRGCRYLDKVPDPKAPTSHVLESESVTFGAALVDRVFQGSPAEVLLEVGTGAAVAVENTSGWRDHVVWNPHRTLPDCWNSFVCVESAVTQPVTLPAGYDWEAETNLSVVDL
jgi:glucose-6-phosphate 1-epimerase